MTYICIHSHHKKPHKHGPFQKLFTWKCIWHFKWSCNKVIFSFLCKQRTVSYLSFAPARWNVHSYDGTLFWQVLHYLFLKPRKCMWARCSYVGDMLNVNNKVISDYVMYGAHNFLFNLTSIILGFYNFFLYLFFRLLQREKVLWGERIWSWLKGMIPKIKSS